MSYLLHIETSTTVCSVAISKNEKLISHLEINNGYTHAENLSIFINRCLHDACIATNQLEAIVVSMGPGSYTGLRIGVATAKGLCYALNIPLIAINSLQALAYSVSQEIKDHNAFYIPMIDARRMEVYASVFDSKNNTIKSTEAIIIDEKSFENELSNKTYFFGDGSEKCKDVITKENAFFLAHKYPSALSLIHLGYQKFLKKEFENVAYFEPYYLKDFIATTPKKII